MRARIKTLLCKSSLGSSVLGLYSEWRWSRLSHSSAITECEKLRTVLETEQASIQIFYDNLVSPPTYGDFLQVVMLARYLKASGADVIFTIIDNGQRRLD